MKKLRTIICLALVLSVCAALLTGCVRTTQLPNPPQKENALNIDTEKNADTTVNNDDAVVNQTKQDKSVLDDKKTETVKPDDTAGGKSDKAKLVGDDWEIVISLDADGLVTEVTAYNDDTFESKSYSGYEGKDRDTVVNELVTAIENAGYFVDDIDNERGYITIEIDNHYDREYDKYYWD
ncbi:MAG: hypothetical protein E7456_05165 [Ruminococcaceae bacterium]|nr:hypothetical protein [Oscillospiraceae bacterium]